MYSTADIIKDVVELAETNVPGWTIWFDGRENRIVALKYKASKYSFVITRDGKLKYESWDGNKLNFEHEVDLSWRQKGKIRRTFTNLLNEILKRDLDKKE